MSRTTVRGLSIRYDVIGKEGPWVALITGGRRGFDEFVPLATRVADHGFRVVLHDRRNTGASDIALEAREVEEITWADDLRILLDQIGALPACIGGSSSGARTAILFGLRHPDVTSALMLLRVTGGAFAARRLPQMYYGQFIDAAENGGMAAVCETEVWQERIRSNPSNREKLMAMDPEAFVAIFRRWEELFEAGAHHPVLGVSNEELESLKMPALVIPGNDRTHSSESGSFAHRMIPNCTMHDLGLSDEDVDLVPFPEWSPHEPEIADALAAFMRNNESVREGP